MTEEKKIDAGILFCPVVPELNALKPRSHTFSQEYSGTREDETERRRHLAGELLAEFGDGSFLQGPVFFHYGKAEDAGGLSPAKDDNAAVRHFIRRTLPILGRVDYIKKVGPCARLFLSRQCASRKDDRADHALVLRITGKNEIKNP